MQLLCGYNLRYNHYSTDIFGLLAKKLDKLVFRTVCLNTWRHKNNYHSLSMEDFNTEIFGEASIFYTSMEWWSEIDTVARGWTTDHGPSGRVYGLSSVPFGKRLFRKNRIEPYKVSQSPPPHA